MILVFLTLFAWFFSFVGLGILTATVIKLSIDDFDSQDHITLWGILGIATAGLTSSILNFFSPIHPLIASSFFISGLFLSVKHRRKIWQSMQLHGFWGLIIVLILLSIIIASAKLFFLDTAVYHLQAIRWITESTAPLGLANLLGKLGFNSLWFPTAAIMELFGLQGKSSFLLNPLLFTFFLFPLFSIIKSLQNKMKLPLKDVFLLTSVLSFIYPFFIEAYIVSPSNDAPILTLGLLILYFLLDTSKPPLFFIFFLSCYAFMIKLSAFPMLLAAPLLFLMKRSYSFKNLNGHGCVYLLSIGAAWLLRGIYSSGCPFYPKNLGCQHQFDWTVPRTVLHGEYDLVKRWARKPYLNAEDRVIDSWDWFRPWFMDLIGTPTFQIALFLFFFGVIGILYFKITVGKEMRLHLSKITLPAAISMIGILFWFSMAPAPRFGLAFIYGLSLLLFSVAIQTSGILNSGRRQLPWMLLLILIIVSSPILLRMHFSQETWVRFPNHPNVSTAIQLTIENKKIHIPTAHPLCWNSELPCAPMLPRELRMETRPAAKLPYQFYYDDEFKKRADD